MRDGSLHDVGNTYTWEEAFAHVAALNAAQFAGYDDWRLPNVKELHSIVDFGNDTPSVASVFDTACAVGCAACSCTETTTDYWTSTSFDMDPGFAWVVNFRDGVVGQVGKPADFLAVRAVRGSADCLPATGQTTCWDGAGDSIPCIGTGQDGELQMGAPLSYTDNGDGTITDETTGLVWEKQVADGGVHDVLNATTWDMSFTHAAALNTAGFAGHADWRVPNVRELLTIVDFERNIPAIAPAFHTGCVLNCTAGTCSCTGSSSPYWTSTTFGRAPAAAWFVHFFAGTSQSGSKAFDPGVTRAVRGQP